MPFTPIHLGPGLAFKALGGRHFSFMVFGGAQVLMDLEPLIGILQDRDVLHGVTHTWLGALVIGSVAAVIGKPISSMVLRWRKIPHPPLTWLAAMAGAYVGTFSHVLLDAIMHADMAPAWPLLPGNPMLDLISIDQLHLACLVAGVIGLPMALMRARADARPSR
ncbi:MAG: hypothetical protein R3E52_02930 [Burkholderiaceae bacterium]